MAADVTIVIPVWDHHTQLLPRCVQAIRSEAVQVDIIVLDNASTIPLPELPPDTQRLTLTERQSIGGARNAGLAHVNTPFVMFADADDEIAPGSLADSLALLQRHPRAAGVLGRSIVNDDGHRRRGIRPRITFRLACQITPWLAPLFWLTDYQCSITSTLLRTATVRDAGGFAETDIGEDWQLAARMARRARFICLDQPVRIYHRHAAAARNAAPDQPSRILQHDVRVDCLTDFRATTSQRLLASILLRAATRSSERQRPTARHDAPRHNAS